MLTVLTSTCVILILTSGMTKEYTLPLFCVPCVLILELLVLLIVVMKLAGHLVNGVLKLCRHLLSLLLLLIRPLSALLLVDEEMRCCRGCEWQREACNWKRDPWEGCDECMVLYLNGFVLFLEFPAQAFQFGLGCGCPCKFSLRCLLRMA